MILFSTASTRFLAQKINAQHGLYMSKRFNDGEFYVCIEQDVHNKHVWVLASTQSPADNLLELFFLLDALKHGGAHISLFITYFAYARQIIAAPNEAHSTHLIAKILSQFLVKKCYILHAHSLLLHNIIEFENVIDWDFFCTKAQGFDAIAAPDQGAYEFARTIAAKMNKGLIVLTKMRPEHEKLSITSVNGIVSGKRILLVDDIISTGNTLVQAAHELKKLGAHSVSAAATHGIFSNHARELLERSSIEKVYVTNSIEQQSQGKIEVSDCSSIINEVIHQSKQLIDCVF